MQYLEGKALVKSTFQCSSNQETASSTFTKKKKQQKRRGKPDPICHPGLSVSLPILSCAPICQARCPNELCGQTGTRMSKHCLDVCALVGTESGTALGREQEWGWGEADPRPGPQKPFPCSLTPTGHDDRAQQGLGRLAVLQELLPTSFPSRLDHPTLLAWPWGLTGSTSKVT